jgi:hypothetical protein
MDVHRLLNLLMNILYRVFQLYFVDCLWYLEYSSKRTTTDWQIVGASGVAVGRVSVFFLDIEISVYPERFDLFFVLIHCWLLPLMAMLMYFGVR